MVLILRLVCKKSCFVLCCFVSDIAFGYCVWILSLDIAFGYCVWILLVLLLIFQQFRNKFINLCKPILKQFRVIHNILICFQI